MRMRLPASVIAVFLVLLVGCSKPLTKSGISPSYVHPYQSTGAAITILPVVIRPQPRPWYATDVQMPDADLYREAIVDTLKRTALFSEVKTSGSADYSLSTEVIGERLLGGASNIGLFLIRYELTDSSSGKKIWSENIFTYSMLSAEQVFAGWERVPKVIETAVSANMKELAASIGKALSTHGR